MPTSCIHLAARLAIRLSNPAPISVTVANGEVTLGDLAATSLQKTRAAQLASGAPGVILVQNSINVPSVTLAPAFGSKSPKSAVLEQAIKQRLALDPLVNMNLVQVEVENGIATLTGTTSSWTARAAAACEVRDFGLEPAFGRVRELNQPPGQSSSRFVRPPYASIRRSRRNGQCVRW